MADKPSLTVGIEEEYLVVDRNSRDLVATPDPGFLARCRDLTGERARPEFFACQIEVGTRPHQTIADAVDDLQALRKGVAAAASEYGYATIAASSHPFADWRNHQPRNGHSIPGHSLGGLLVGGCHIHVAIEDEDLRIELMNQMVYFLPLLLALSCSSPFWRGQDSGNASHRLTVFQNVPRTGLPDPVYSFGEYARLVGALTRSGCIEDATRIWWDIRPSAKFPTLEQRITDVPATAGETLALAGLYQTLLAYLFRLRSESLARRYFAPSLVGENRWRAARYGVTGDLVDFGRFDQRSVADLLDELLDAMAEDADSLGTAPFLEEARRIVQRGSSAQRQRRVFQGALSDGAHRTEALWAVVDSLIGEFAL